jgi:hypothetical protein
MNSSEIKDGTWTLRVVDCEDGVWEAKLDRLWVISQKFRRARFVLVGGPTVLVSAQDLDNAIDFSMPPAEMRCPLRIDPERKTINDYSVDLHEEA